MTLSLEEASQVVGVNTARVVSVDGPECCKWSVVKSEFKAALQGVQSTLQVDLLLNDFAEATLDVKWQAVVATHVVGTAVKSDVPQVVVSAWENELQEATKLIRNQTL